MEGFSQPAKSKRYGKPSVMDSSRKIKQSNDEIDFRQRGGIEMLANRARGIETDNASKPLLTGHYKLLHWSIKRHLMMIHVKGLIRTSVMKSAGLKIRVFTWEHLLKQIKDFLVLIGLKVAHSRKS